MRATAGTSCRRRINPLPAELHKGDVVRDLGRDRVVLRTEKELRAPVGLVIIHFEEEPSLAVNADQRITAWRADE